MSKIVFLLTLLNFVSIQHGINIYNAAPTFGIGKLLDQFSKQPIINSKNNTITKSDDVDLILSDVPADVSEKIIAQFSSGRNNEDINLNVVQLIQKYGFNVETHRVQTDDGYVLTMFRIPGNGSAVLLMHGLLSSADDYVVAGPDSGLAYVLAREGYDVWMGNARGNKHSRRHARLSPESAEFWNFSWDEIGRLDLPAKIDYVLNTTGQSRLKYVGHSQGTTSFFVLCSQRPEYNDKISIMVALSAVAWMSHLKSPGIRLISPIYNLIYTAAKLFGLHEFLPDKGLVKSWKTALCVNNKLAEIVCSNILFLIFGFNYAQLNVTNLPVILSHVPSGAATKQVVHYGQGIESGKFQRFDYGETKNKDLYNSRYPPEYPVEKICAPVAIFYSHGDWLASVEDVLILRSKLRNVVDFYRIPDKKFNHGDFIWAKDVKNILYIRILKLFEKIK